MSQAQRGVIALLLLLVMWCGWQSRLSSQHPPTKDYAQQATHDRSTIVAPEKSSEKITDWLLVALNFFLVGSTLLLWKANNRSARIAERALTELEAPFVSIKINAPGLDIKGRTVTFGLLKWCVINHGRTPATILEISDQVKSVESGKGWPPVVDPVKIDGDLMPYGVIAPPNGQSEDFPHLAIANLIPGTGLDEVPFSQKVPFFMGFVRYADILKNRFVLGFCFLFDRNGNRWILAGGNEYNYCCRDNKPPPPSWFQPTSATHSLRSELFRNLKRFWE